MNRVGTFDIIERRTLAAVWYEAERIVHGDALCLYDVCPHAIDMSDLLTAISRIHPLLYEDETDSPVFAN